MSDNDEDALQHQDDAQPSVGTPIDMGRRYDEIQLLKSIAAGKRQPGSGPTGKQVWVFPTPAERLRAIEMLRGVAPAVAQANAAPSPEETERARQTLDALVEERARLIVSKQQPDIPEVDPLYAEPTVTDLDLQLAAPSKTTADENNPREGDLIHFAGGYYAVAQLDATGQIRWVCYTDQGERHAIKATAAAARDHFWSFTTMGQSLKGERPAEPVTPKSHPVTAASVKPRYV